MAFGLPLNSYVGRLMLLRKKLDNPFPLFSELRPIQINSVILKTLEKIIMIRLRPYINQFIHKRQKGFKPGVGT